MHKRQLIHTKVVPQPLIHLFFPTGGFPSAMLSVSRLSLSLVLAGTALAGQVQDPSIVLPPSARTHQEAVVQIFNQSYQFYRSV